MGRKAKKYWQTYNPQPCSMHTAGTYLKNKLNSRYVVTEYILLLAWKHTDSVQHHVDPSQGQDDEVGWERCLVHEEGRPSDDPQAWQ
jgi:hypothetical protein